MRAEGEPVDAEAQSPADVLSFRRRLAAAILQSCPRWLAEDREDLLQAAWVRLTEVLNRQDAALSTTYLWRIAHSVVIDEVRKRRARREIAIEDTADQSPELVAGRSDPEQQFLTNETVLQVRACLAQLAQDRRRAVQLRLAGFEPLEIARHLERTSKQTANLVFRGLEQLRACLRAKGVVS